MFRSIRHFVVCKVDKFHTSVYPRPKIFRSCFVFAEYWTDVTEVNLMQLKSSCSFLDLFCWCVSGIECEDRR